MAQIEVVIDADKQLTIFHILGELSADEIVQQAEQYYPHPTGLNIIWDLTHGSIAGIDDEGFKLLAKTGKRFAPYRQGGRNAYIGDSNLQYGLSRMYTQLAEIAGVPIAYSTFHHVEQALDWLSGEAVTESA